MRFLISGLGSIGQRHARNLLSLGEDDLVFLRSGKGTLQMDGFEEVPCETDLDLALEKWSPDAVVISNPTSEHLPVALRAARNGCHILLEKPVSHNLEGIEALEVALEKNDCDTLVGYQFRFHPGLEKVKALLDAGDLGRPISVNVHWGEYLPDWHRWEDYRQSYSARVDLGGGVILTLSHPFDYLRWFFGDVDSISAAAGTFGDLDIDVEDTAEITLFFGSGLIASVHLDYNQRPPRHGLEIICTEGTIEWDSASGAARWWTAAAGGWQEQRLPENFERNSLFLAEMEHFIDVARRTAEPKCTLEDGVRALEIALAAKQSALEKSATISLGKP